MNAILKSILKALGWLLMLPVYFYKYAISPLTSPSCRHVPTCSQYAIGALERHGAAAGSYLTLRRLARCHPWCAGGCDPVPDQPPRLFTGLTASRRAGPTQPRQPS